MPWWIEYDKIKAIIKDGETGGGGNFIIGAAALLWWGNYSDKIYGLQKLLERSASDSLATELLIKSKPKIK